MLVSVAQAQLFLLGVTRIMAVIIHIPVLGGNNIPNQVRIALGIVLTAIMVPWATPLGADVEAMGMLAFAAAILRELIIGTLAGYAASLTFGAMQIAGEAMGLGSGFGSGRVLNPTMGEMGSPFDTLFVLLASLVFLLINGHHEVLIALKRTFDVLPLNQPLPEALAANRLVPMFSLLVMTGIQIALPVMGALLLTDLTLGLLARVAPSIQVFFLGMPVKVAIALVAFGLSFVVLMPNIINVFQQIGDRMLALIGG